MPETAKGFEDRELPRAPTRAIMATGKLSLAKHGTSGMTDAIRPVRERLNGWRAISAP
jgi:hypothetical protein